MPLISGKELLLFVNHGSCIFHLVDYSATPPQLLPVLHSSSLPLFLSFYPPLPTVSLSLCVAVYTMEVPTKWSRASVISFIKGLGKNAGVCIHVHAGLHHLTTQVSHKQVAVCEAWGPVVSRN